MVIIAAQPCLETGARGRKGCCVGDRQTVIYRHLVQRPHPQKDIQLGHHENQCLALMIIKILSLPYVMLLERKTNFRATIPPFPSRH